MADGRPAYDPDRLPWLAEDRRRRRRNDSTPLMLWALFATLLVAGVSYWMGMKSVTDPDPFADFASPSPAATVRLPEPAAAPPRAQEAPPSPVEEVPPVVEPAPVPIPRVEPVRTARPETQRPARKSATSTRKARPRAAPARKRTTARRTSTLRAWPADQSAGAHGRLVRVGTFYSRRQAKQAWARIVRVYPGMRNLRAVVVPNPSLRNGRTFYRLQFGTTSQAHSTVLCQRMRIVGQSCVVVGLPGREGGVRR
jgi:hypothetical protein